MGEESTGLGSDAHSKYLEHAPPPSRKNSHINAFQRRMQKAEDLASWRNKFRVT
jgi:hypothetical protein